MTELKGPQSGIKAQRKVEAERIDTHMSVVYSECSELQPAITSKLTTFGGKPCIAETRIPVALVLRYLVTGEDPIEDFGITQKDVEACLSFAAMVCDYSSVERE
jgi:uncharacterized protein (DUF433 family)